MPDLPARHGAQPKRERLSAHERGYDGSWVRFRKWYAATHPAICVRCGHAGPSREMHLDHKIPLTGQDDPTRLDPDAVQWLCESCHNLKTATEDNGFGRLT